MKLHLIDILFYIFQRSKLLLIPIFLRVVKESIFFSSLFADGCVPQFYQYAQPQPNSACVPLYSHNQVPFYSQPPAFFSQPAAPASTPVPVQSQLCSSTSSSEGALGEQPNQPLYKPGQTSSAIMNLNDCSFLLMNFSVV